ncbi:MAG: energy-coupling factor transporter ATPase [Ignisphaera sp.]|nr:energy-coupling factor transporter ATPase [Ignisphaera sp.]MDW8085594.1 energy-coupling factor transporter ATPase [Ignisphaera sp.]
MRRVRLAIGGEHVENSRVYAVEVDKLTFRYRNSTSYALKGVSFKVRKGEFFTIVGPNGSGKTTLALSLVGVIPHYIEGEYYGSVFVDGIDVRSRTVLEMVTRIGLVMQNPDVQIVGITVRDDVAFGLCNLGLPRELIIDRIDRALEAVRLKGYEDRLTHTLSSGERQRLAIAGVLSLEPNVVVADEPTSQLDPAGKIEFFNVIHELNRRRGKTVIVITSDVEWALRFSDRVGLLVEGRLLFLGPPREFVARVDLEELTRHGVRAPQVLHLYHKLINCRAASTDLKPWLHAEEAYLELRSVIGRESCAACGDEEAAREGEAGAGEELAIDVRNLWYVYPGGIVALRDVSLKIRRGEFVAIVGQNGSGKTTLVKHFNGLLKPTRGQVLVCGVDTRRRSVAELAQRVGFVSQNPDLQIFTSSVRDEVALGVRSGRLPAEEIEKRIEWVLNLTGLKDLEREHPYKLSRSERVLLVLASALALNPEIVVVDEPTAGLDWRGVQNVMKVLAELHRKGLTIVVVTHDMDIVARYAERVVVMHKGEVALNGGPRDILYSDILPQLSIEPPPIVRIMKNLNKHGYCLKPLTVDEALEKIMRCRGVGLPGLHAQHIDTP